MTGRAAVLVLCCLCLAAGRAGAADTMEPFAIGATDVDFYLGFDGLGAVRDSQAMFGDLMLGYGISDRLSAFLGATLIGDAFLARGEAGLYLGLYGTVLDSNHVDLDLILAVEAGGPGFSTFGLLPGLELNLDLAEDMSALGFYWRSLAGLSGAPPADGAEAGRDLHLALIQILGVYQTVAEDHQILLEADLIWRPRPHGERRWEMGGLALGYNLALSERIELIHQVFVDLPQGGERAAVGFMAGFIATLPSGGPG